MALWDEIDEPVLRWVHCLPAMLDQDRTYELAVREPVDCGDIPGLRSDEVHESLARLRDYGLIDAQLTEYVSGAKWYSIRSTALGLMVLGEWPDMDRVVSVSGLQLLLQQFADASNDSEEKGALRRAMGAIGRLGGDIVRGTWTGVAGAAGKELSAGDTSSGLPGGGAA